MRAATVIVNKFFDHFSIVYCNDTSRAERLKDEYYVITGKLLWSPLFCLISIL